MRGTRAVLHVLAAGFGLWLLLCNLAVANAQETAKSVGVVPKSGPLEGQTVYTGTYALFVGIGSYQNPQIPNIKSAPNDAKTLRNLLVEKYGFDADPNRSVVITDEAATKQRIDREIARLCDYDRVKPTDRVLVYFSCHGQGVPLPDGSKVGYLIPYDAEVDLNSVNKVSGYQTSCVDMEDVVKRLRGCPARHRTVIVDSCFSGFAAGSKALAGRTYSPETLRNMLGQAGLVVMTAGGDEEEAQGEASATGLSLFTRALVDTLNEGSLNGGTFTAEQLAAEAAVKTLDRSGGKQKPEYGQKDGSGQMLLFSSTTSTPPVATSPEIVPLATTATLSVRVTPSDATITVDDNLQNAVSTYALDPGGKRKVKVIVRREGYLPAGFTVTLVAGETTPLSVSLTKSSAPPTPLPTTGLLDIGSPAPAIDAIRWIRGEPLDHFEKGKIYVVEFWATWCGPCRPAVPKLTGLAKKYGDKVRVIGVDSWENDPSEDSCDQKVAQFIKNQGSSLDYDIAVDGVSGITRKSWMDAAKEPGIPTAFVVDRSGTIAWIGHPMIGLEEVIGRILSGTYDRQAEIVQRRVSHHV